MTLILIAMNQQFALQVSDRRLTSGKGLVVDDEHNKSFELDVPGFRFVVSYAGLARIGEFRTSEFLVERIRLIGKSELRIAQILSLLKDDLNQRFYKDDAIQAISPASRRLDVSFVGYNYTTPMPHGLAGYVTNMGSPDGVFRVGYEARNKDAPDDWTWVGAFGTWPKRNDAQEQEMRDALTSGLSPAGVRAVLEARVRQVANDPSSGGVVGLGIDHIVIHSDPRKPTTAGRSTPDKNETLTPVKVMVGMARPSIRLPPVLQGPVIQPLSHVPAVHRNQPCPCGSGKRYRDCHRPKQS